MTDNVENKDAIDVPCLNYSAWMTASELPRTLMMGTSGMKLAGETFLTKNALETDEAYKKRLEASVLLNAYRKTASFLSGQVFQSDVIFAEGVAQDIVDMCSNIDGKGNSINVFAKRVFINGLGKGVSHILVDVPRTGGAILTQAEEKEKNIRPYFHEIRPEDLIGFRTDENGKLEQIRIRETKVVPDGLYGQKAVPCIRLFRNTGEWELHEKRDSGSYVLTTGGMLSYPGIPLISFIPGEEWTIVTGETPLMDLAELNLHHWRSSSDQVNILHIGRVPILFGRNIDVSKIPVGGGTMISSDEDSSDLKFVEISGAAIAAGAVDIKENEAKMALYGLQQLVPRSGNMTATEKAITSGESQSSLGAWATEFESALQSAFEVFEKFRGQVFPKEGVKVNKEYNFGIANDQELMVLLKANEQGIISDQATFTEMKKRGVLDEHLVWDDIKAEMDLESKNQTNMANLAGTFFGGVGTTGTAGGNKAGEETK